MKKNERIIALVIAVVLLFTSVVVTRSVGNKKCAELEARYTDEVEAAQAKIDSLTAELEAGQAEIKALTDETDASQGKIDSLTAEVEAAQTKIESLTTEMESAQAELDSLKEQAQLQEDLEKIEEDMMKELYFRIDYKDEPVYVIGHISPDSDTVGSAIGMAYLLNALGIEAEARVAGPLNPETKYAYSVIGCPIPELLEDASGKQLWLVDHSTSSQMVNGADKARIVGITDHHGIGNAETSEMINVLSCRVGSVSSLILMQCLECGVELPREVAGALLVGLLSDTVNMNGNDACTVDKIALDILKEITGVFDTDSLFNQMREAMLSYRGLSDSEIFYSDYRKYETAGYSYGIGNIVVASEDKVPEMSDRMLDAIKAEAENGLDVDFMLYEVCNEEFSLAYIGYVGKDDDFTEEVMSRTFGDRYEKSDECYVLSPSLQRKKYLVPMIDETLKAMPKSSDTVTE